MQETDVERYLKERVESLGGLCWKFTSPGTRGVPDRYIALNGVSALVEVKAPGEKPSKLQMKRISQVRDRECQAHWVDSPEEVDQLIQHVFKGGVKCKK